MQTDAHKNEDLMRNEWHLRCKSLEVFNNLLIFGLGNRQRLTLVIREINVTVFNAIQDTVKKLFGSFFMIFLRSMPFA